MLALWIGFSATVLLIWLFILIVAKVLYESIAERNSESFISVLESVKQYKVETDVAIQKAEDRIHQRILVEVKPKPRTARKKTTGDRRGRPVKKVEKTDDK